MPEVMTAQDAHPWISYKLDLRGIGPELWIKLGECQSNCEHIAGVPLGPAVAEKLHGIYLAKGLLATTAIEGNTLSEAEVRKILEGTSDLPKSLEYQKLEIENILIACHEISAFITSGTRPPLTPARIAYLNKQVLAGLKLEEGIVPGVMRKYQVGIARYKAPHPSELPYLMEKLCDWLEGSTFASPDSELVTVRAILKAIVAHLYLAWIHPFGDGNGRTARLVELQILLASGVPAPAAHLLSNHYNQTRAEYYRRLDAASRSGGDVIPFIEYAVQGLLDGLTAQLSLIRSHQLHVAWINLVHEALRNRNSPAWTRRRHLVLDLTEADKAVPFHEIRHLSPRLAEEYSNKTDRTVRRDLLQLILDEGLVKRVADGYKAKKEIMLAFLPVSANAEGSEDPEQMGAPRSGS